MYNKADVLWDQKLNEATVYLTKTNGEQTKLFVKHVYSWKDAIEILTSNISPYGVKIVGQKDLHDDRFIKEQTFTLG